MQLPQPLVRAQFIRRLNRFAILVRLEDGRTSLAHLPNSGRLHEVLQVGNLFWLVERPLPHRRTRYDAVLSQDGDTLVCVDARLPPKLLLEGIERGKVRAFGKVLAAENEIRLHHHRLDLQLLDPSGVRWLVETKSVTLVVNEVALFPDAPTQRGQAHLRLLTELQRQGVKTAVVFVVQREDAQSFAPHEQADPAFANALREAAKAGVRVLAYRCRVSFTEIAVCAPIPVRWTSSLAF